MEKKSRSVSRVLCRGNGVCHLSGTGVTAGLKQPTLRLGRATLIATVYMVLQPIRCTAADVTIRTGALLPHLFTLTPKGGIFLLHYCALTNVFLLGSMVPCVARTFL